MTAKKTKKSTKKKKSRKKLRFKALHGAILALIIITFSLLALFLTQKLLEPTNLARILPAEQTVGFVTVNTNDLSTLPEDYAYSQAGLASTIATYLNQESFDLAKEWFGGAVGMAVFMGSNQETENIYFFEYTNRALAVEFLESLTAPEEELSSVDYEGATIYYYPLSQNFSAAFAGNYLVLAENKDNLHLIIDTSRGNSSSLKSDSYYSTVADNLPYNATAVTYWNIRDYPEIIESTIPIYEVIPESLVSPVLAIFPAFGAAGQMTEEGFKIQTYTAVEKELITDSYYYHILEKYQARLAKYIPEEPTFFWGGLDLDSETQRLLTIFDQFHQSAGIILEAILRSKAQEYFGDNIDLDYDIYPLFQYEYALSVYEGEDGEREYLCLLELGDQEDKQIHIDTLKKGFLEQQIYSEPYVQTYTLEDGTEGKEIVADLAEILSQNITYEDVEITMFYLSNDETLGYMTVFADNFAFATDLEILKYSIDLMKSPDGSLSASTDMEAINAIMLSADEASYIDLSDLRDSEFWGIEFFSAWDGFSSTKNFFDDGVATFHLLVRSQK